MPHQMPVHLLEEARGRAAANLAEQQGQLSVEEREHRDIEAVIAASVAPEAAAADQQEEGTIIQEPDGGEVQTEATAGKPNPPPGLDPEEPEERPATGKKRVPVYFT